MTSFHSGPGQVRNRKHSHQEVPPGSRGGRIFSAVNRRRGESNGTLVQCGERCSGERWGGAPWGR